MTSNTIYHFIQAIQSLVEAQYRQDDEEYLQRKIEDARQYLDLAEKTLKEQKREGEE
jgi:hypothetical protein